MSLFIGLDLSLTATGLAVTDVNRKPVTHFLIGSEKRGAHRLQEMRDKLRRHLDTFKPRAVAVEDYAMGYGGKDKNPGRTYSIGEWGGVVRLELLERKIDTITVPPANLKMYVAGSGAASKDEVMTGLLRTFSIHTADDNIADAYGLSLMANHFFKKDQNSRHSEKQGLAIEKVTQIVWAPAMRVRQRV